MSDIDKEDVYRIMVKVLKKFREKVDHIHVSFDVDSVSPSVAPGVEAPIRGGLSYRETHLVMNSVVECGCMSSFEVAEINSFLNYKNKTTYFTADLVALSMGEGIL